MLKCIFYRKDVYFQFIFSQPGLAFSRRGPVRRIPVTDTLFFRAEKERSLTRIDPSQLLEKEENEPPPAAHYAAGTVVHNVSFFGLYALES